MKHPRLLVIVLCVAAFCVGHQLGNKPSRHVCTHCREDPADGSCSQARDMGGEISARVKEDTYEDGRTKQLTIDYSDGPWRSVIRYYPDGGMKALETRHGSLRNGVCAYFSKDGTPRTVGVFTNSDLAAGTFRQYYGQYSKAPTKESEGRLYIQHEGIGCKTGRRIVLRENGLTNCVVPYRDGKPHGPSPEYDKGGRLDCIREYKNGNETRRTGYDANGEKRYLSDVQDGCRIWINYGPNEQVRSRERTSRSGEGTIETYAPDRTLASRTKKTWGFPLVKRDFYPSGKTKALRSYEDGTLKHFDENGVLTEVDQYEYNVLISRKTLNANGETVKTETFGKPEPPPEEWPDFELPELPGSSINAPQVFYAYRSYPGIRCNNDMDLAWPQTMHNWYKTARFAGGSYDTRYPESYRTTAGEICYDFTATTTNIAAIGVGCHAVGDGPGWIRLTVRENAGGKPSDKIVARSWLRYPVYCQVPSRGLMVFRLPEFKWEIGKKYWFDCSVDLEASASNAHHINYWLIGDGDTPAFRIIESCGPVPMQRRVTTPGGTPPSS